jgi:P-type Mg2+ transporter
LRELRTTEQGLTPEETATRLASVGANVVQGHSVRLVGVLLRQLRSPLLLLLVVASGLSFLFGERASALIILAIIALSVGLGFVNEYRSERAVQELHSRIRPRSVAVRGGRLTEVNVTELVPGDLVRLDVGDVVPADLRLLEAHAMECEEGVITGESPETAHDARRRARAGARTPQDRR